MRAIVTGGAGFIGSHVVDALLARGDEVHVLDDLSKGTREASPARRELHVADIRRARRGVRRGAARGRLPPRRAGRRPHVRRAARPRRRRQRARHGRASSRRARRHDAQIVFSSTGGAIYGECDGPAPETAPRQPLAPYGASKLCGEEYLATWNRLYGTRHVSLRFGNVYGPRQEPHGEAGVVAIFIGLLRDGGTPKIYGDGSQTRDYVFVGDVVARDAARPEPRRRRLQRRHRARDLGRSSCTTRSRGQRDRAEAELAPARLGELQRSVLDPSLAARELGWRRERALAGRVSRRPGAGSKDEAGARPPTNRFGPWITHSIFLTLFPWRTATVVVGASPLIELVALLAIGPCARRLCEGSCAAVTAPATQSVSPAGLHARAAIPSVPLRPRSQLRVLVLNGNGVAGAAGARRRACRARLRHRRRRRTRRGTTTRRRW